MKKLILLLTGFYLLSLVSMGQVVDDSLLSTTRLNIAIPEIPAFKALGTEPGTILRPSDIKSFALMITDFRSGGNFFIPRSFAAEVAPGMLASPSVSLNEYRNNAFFRFLYKTRFSLGTTQEAENTGARQMSGGVRFALLDKGDFKLDTAFLNANIYRALDDSAALLENAKRAYMKKYDKNTFEVDRESQQYKDVLDSVYRSVKIQSVAIIGDAIIKYKKENWNAQRLEIAYALTGTSPDSSFNNISASRHNVWIVYAQALGHKNHWGQLLIGLNFITEKDSDKFHNSFDIPARLYAGTNRLKAFAELEYRYRQAGDQGMFINCGAELNIKDGIWINFSGGVDNAFLSDAKSQFVSNLKFNFTLPEKFKLN